MYEISILLVDDNIYSSIDTKKKLLSPELEIKNFFMVKTLAKAIDILKNNKVDMVLLELELEDSKGLATLSEIQKVYSGCVIIITKGNGKAIGGETIKEGACDYMIKNQLNNESLALAIKSSIDKGKIHTKICKIQEDIDLLKNSLKTQ